MKKIYCHAYLVCINLLTINFCILLGQTITQQLTVYVQPGVFPGIEGTYRELKQEADQEQKKTAARIQQEQEARRQKEAEELRIQTAAYCAKIDALCADDNNTTAIPCDHAQARHTAYTQIKTNAISRTTKSYTVDAETVNVAHAYDIQEQDLTAMHGNAYEHQLHTELLEQLGEVHTISAYYGMSSHNLLVDAVGHSIAIGMEANRLRQPEVATIWANCGWQLLEIIEGIGEGLVQCIQNNVEMVLHPIHTLTNMVHGLKTVTGYCLRAIGTVIRWELMMERGQKLLVAQEMDEVDTQIAACGTLLATMPPRDIAKNVTAVAADIVLVPKMLSFGSTLCSRAAPLIEEAVVAIRDRVSRISNAIAHAIETARTESPVVQTTEGLIMRMSEDLRKVGGSVGEVIKDARLALEIVHAQYMSQLKTDLEILRLACDNKVKDIVRFGDKYLKPQYEHIFGMEFFFVRETVTQVKGFHHDLMHAIEKSGAIPFANKRMFKHGFYTVDLIIDGQKFPKSLFPAEWTREKVMNKLYEAYENYIKSGRIPTLNTSGKYVIESFIEEGIEIKMCITQKGKILTAYPILK
jgi:hypothetical protein